MRVFAALLALIPVITAQDNCVPQASTSFELSDYVNARSQCNDKCRDEGFCCPAGRGLRDYTGDPTAPLTGHLPCNEGCHLAFFSSTIDECKAECDASSYTLTYSASPNCWYRHPRHYTVREAGFLPDWKKGYAMSKCNHMDCRCPGATSTPENSAEACRKGCDIAATTPASGMFNGLDATFLPPNSKTDLLAAIGDLSEHILSDTLTETEILDRLAVFIENEELIPTEEPIIKECFDLIDTYEENMGPLFINNATKPFYRRGFSIGFDRVNATDGKEIHRAMIAIMQSVLDRVYSGSLFTDFNPEPQRFPNIIAPCSDLLVGRSWKTARNFPGWVEPPSDPTVSHTVNINATMPRVWGRRDSFNTKMLTRPTGLYLSPGQIATVTVPSAVVTYGKFKIQVGGAITDHSGGGLRSHMRLDRITTTSDVGAETTNVANPLGGYIYIRVPYLAELGVISISVSGGVIPGPFFHRTSLKQTTEQEWDEMRNSPSVPWSIFMTDKVLLELPSIWSWDYSYSEISSVLSDYDTTMDGISEYLGIPPNKRNNYGMYEMVDIQNKFRGKATPGYPMANWGLTTYPRDQTEDYEVGIQPERPNIPGRSDGAPHITNGKSRPTLLHELGHQNNPSMYGYLETEAIIEMLRVYVQNIKWGIDFEASFRVDQVKSHSIDTAAMSWVITDEFKNGQEMTQGQTQYSARGYARYADLVRIFSWDVMISFHHQEHLDENAGTSSSCPGLGIKDDRTYRISLKAGYDVTPLIHFWGVQPVDEAALKSCMAEANVGPSYDILAALERYKTAVIPTSKSEARALLDQNFPGDPCSKNPCKYFHDLWEGWNDSSQLQMETSIAALEDVIAHYYPPVPSTAPTTQPSLSIKPSVAPSTEPSVVPTSLPTVTPYSLIEYGESRQQCTNLCNADGYCCTLGSGCGGFLPCNEGCHLAFFTSTVEECEAECDATHYNVDGRPCYYAHPRHEEVASAGFNPFDFGAQWGHPYVIKCKTPLTCGCSTNAPVECNANACKAGCQHAANVTGMYNGLDIALGSFFPTAAPPSPPATPSVTTFSTAEYADVRQNCTNQCNDAGYCCTNGNGGWNNVPCNEGCHIAFFSSTLEECAAECEAGNDGVSGHCRYTHSRHNDILAAGFNPKVTGPNQGFVVAKCTTPESCGCPAEYTNLNETWYWDVLGRGTDAGRDACMKGCLYASQMEGMYNGIDAIHDSEASIAPSMEPSVVPTSLPTLTPYSPPTPAPVAPTPAHEANFQSSTDFSVAFGFYGIEIKEIASDADQVVIPLPASYASSPGKFRWRSVAGVDQDNIDYRGTWNRETGGVALDIDVTAQFQAFGVTVTGAWPTGADAGTTPAILEDVKGFFSFSGKTDQPLIYLPASISTIKLKATVNNVTGPVHVITVNESNHSNADECFEKVELTEFPENTNNGTVVVQSIKEESGFSEGDMFWLPAGSRKLFKYRAVANGYTGSIWNTFRVVAENGGGDDSAVVTDGELDVSQAFQTVTIQNLQPNVVVEVKSNNEAMSITGNADGGAEQIFDMPTRIYKWRVMVNGKGGAFKDNVVAVGTDWTIDASIFFCAELAYVERGETCASPIFYDDAM